MPGRSRPVYSSAVNEPCPKCEYVRQPGDAGALGECPRCGVYYAKYLRRRALEEADASQVALVQARRNQPFGPRLWASLWQVPDRVDQTAFYGRCLALAVVVAWGAWFIWQPWYSEDIGASFLHRPDLAFHEFGHVLFRPFGEWMMFLGGSLFQCLLPLMLAVYFLVRQGQPFSAAMCLWWCGQNLIDVAPYIGDARDLALPLVGEWSEEDADLRAFRHDWHNILGAIGWLSYDQMLGQLAKFTGAVLMVISWTWGGLVLRLQQRNLAGDVYRG